VFRLNGGCHNGEALKRPLVVWRELEASVKHTGGAIDVVGTETEVIPPDRFKRERDEVVLGGVDDRGKILGPHLAYPIKVGQPVESQKSPSKPYELRYSVLIVGRSLCSFNPISQLSEGGFKMLLREERGASPP